MKKGKLVSKIFGTATVLVMVWTMLGGLPAFVDKVEASPAIIYVPDDYSTIQAAVDAANPGDTIVVRDGTYSENVDVYTDHLTIQSENEAETTIVQAANPDDHVFEVTADYVVISGFTLVDATGGTSYEGSGIFFEHVAGCNISNNKFSNNSCGIYLRYSNKNMITDNKIWGNVHGVELVHSQDNEIKSSEISDNGEGIYLSYSSNYNKITNNTFVNDGLSVSSASISYQNKIEDNTVNGKPLVYLEGISDYNIEEAGQVILVNCDRVVVEDLDLSNTDIGIELLQTDNSILMNNKISGSGDGIFLSSSENNQITNNKISDSGKVIYLGGVTHHLNGRGVCLCSSNKNTIIKNELSNNAGHGIDISWSEDNLIYLNNFIKNNGNVVAYNSSNSWNSFEEITYPYNENTYTGYMGNYWSDYRGGDVDGNGIGDTSYSINSEKDNYPLMEIYDNYEIGPSPKAWYVDDDRVDYPDADFTEIHDAVDAATAGDAIIVYPGTYTENVEVNKEHLTIKSENGADSTIVQAKDSNDHVFEVTADYVTINGFTVKGGTGFSSGFAVSGIYLKGSVEGTIADKVEHCRISENIVSNNRIGILLYFSYHNTLTNNIVNSNTYYGIELYSGSAHDILTNNIVNSNNISGILLAGASQAILAGNAMSDNKYNLEIGGWAASSPGLWIRDYAHDIDTSNTVSGKAVYYLVDESDTIIGSSTNAGYVGLVSCTNMTVKDLTLSNNAPGVMLINCSDSVIENVNVSNCECGIYLLQSSTNTLSRNILSDNYNGIRLWFSPSNTLNNNLVKSSTYYGMDFTDSQSNCLINNTVSDSRYNLFGAGLGVSQVDSSNTVNGKPVYYWVNKQNDQVPNDAGYVGLVDCTNVTVKALTLSSNGEGVLLHNSTGCRIEKVNLLNNRFGVSLINSSNNEIYLNNFVDNQCNAPSSHGSINIWNSPEEITYTYGGSIYTDYLGNYWDDYAGSDADGDGIGETPYPIDSDADNYPLVADRESYSFVVVSIDAPGEVTEESDFIVDVAVDYVENFDSCGFDVTYDETIITVTDVTGGEIDGHTVEVGPGDWSYIPPGPDPGRVRVIAQMGGTAGVTGTGYIAQIHYHVLGSVCNTSSICLENLAMYDCQAQGIATTTVDDSVHVAFPSLEMATTALSKGNVGDIYSAALEATGGKPPYTWEASGLPAGLSCSGAGVISGTPTEVGLFAVVVTVTDALANSDSKDLTVKIACKHGDVNMDGTVDTGDITKVKRIYFELNEPTPCADVNGDERIDTGDMTAIKLIYFGINVWGRVSTPTTEGWVLAPDSVIVDYAVAGGGDVAYAIVYSYGDEEFRLLTSTDCAATWDDITAALEKVDDGSSIQVTWRVTTDGEDPDFVAVALVENGKLRVYFSTDAGDSFEDAGEVEDGGVYLDLVSDLAISPEAKGKREIAIGGMDNSGSAALFRCTVTEDTADAWEDATAYAGWDDESYGSPFTSELVTGIMFSTSWATDKTILVTTIDVDGTWNSDVEYATVYVQCGSWGTTAGWNEKSTLGIEAVRVIEDVDIPMWLADLDARRIAGMTLPEDYNSKNTDTRYAWVWVNYYDDYGYPACVIMWLDDDSTDPVGPMGQIEDGEVWLTNISYKGTIAEGEAVAGVLGTGTFDPVHGSSDELIAECCEGVQVFRNDGIRNMDICCERWHDACKPPTGTFAMAVSYVGEDKAYAVALWGFFLPHDEDAWSVTFDDGDTWNQLSLIDSDIDYLSDVAVSPDCNKTMLVSVNDDDGCACDSVWLYAVTLPEAEEYSGQWLRTWCGQLEGVSNDVIPGSGFTERGLLRLAPEETTGDTVFLFDRMSGNVYMNDLETLACWDPIASTVADYIVDLAARDADTLYALDYDGYVAMFDDDEWQEAVDTDVDTGYTVAVWGDHILVGAEDGEVSYSDDGGDTFTQLEDVAVAGLVTVAFDSYFEVNHTVYAALADADDHNGIYRWVVGGSTDWEDLAAGPYDCTDLVLDRPAPANPMTSADTGGVLYASYVSGDTTGVARCLTPADDVCCGSANWDYLTMGLTSELFGMVPQALKICGCLTADTNSRLFAIDGSEPYDIEKGRTGTVWSFEDPYAKTGQ